MTHKYVQRPGLFGGAPFNKTRCAAMVMTREKFPRSYQCRRRPVVAEDGEGWCKQHAPSSEREREQANRARFAARIAQSPAVRLGETAQRLRRLQTAIDDFLADRITADQLREARNG